MSNKTEFTFEQACDYLEIDGFQLEREIINSNVRVGIYAKNWIGYCINNVSENNEVNFHELNQFELSTFWYLSSDNATSIILDITPPENEITLFSPLEGQQLTEQFPEIFTCSDFQVAILQNYRDIGISKCDFVFQLIDLQNGSQDESNSIELTLATVENEHYFKDGGDELAQLMRSYFYDFTITNKNIAPTVMQLWSLMITQCKYSQEAVVYYKNDLKVIYLENASEGRENVDLPAFKKRYKRYTTKPV